MDLSEIGNLIVKVGILPAIIAASFYMNYRLTTDQAKAITENTCALAENTAALDKLADYVRGRNDA